MIMYNLDFEASEYQQRLQKAQSLMIGHRIDALFMTTEGNLRYFTGHTTHRWMQTTAPQFAILPKEGQPILIVPNSDTKRAQGNPVIKEVRGFVGFQQVGITELCQA